MIFQGSPGAKLSLLTLIIDLFGELVAQPSPGLTWKLYYLNPRFRPTPVISLA
jgi:hypothetical protein